MAPPHEQRRRSIEALIDNARTVSETRMPIIREWPGLVVPKVDGKPVPLPGYVPYVGTEYFSSRTRGHRILAYALSQNLHPGADYTLEWAKDWDFSDGRIALDRQDESFDRCGFAMMYPFDTGHIPVLCALLRHHILRYTGHRSLPSIYAEIAATNLSKFSFRTSSGRRTTDYAESLRFCWQWFSVSELATLKPDFILCAGSTTHRIVADGVAALPRKPSARPIVLKVAFPSLRVINRWYRKHQKPVRFSVEDILSFVPKEDLNRRVKQSSMLFEVVRRDWYYFAKMYDLISQQLEELHGTV